jgi:hypothetical protein
MNSPLISQLVFVNKIQSQQLALKQCKFITSTGKALFMMF